MKWIQFDDKTALNLDQIYSVEIEENCEDQGNLYFIAVRSMTGYFVSSESFKTVKDAKKRANEVFKDFQPYPEE